MDKTYIGREEAFEIMLARGIDKLPRKGREIVTVRSNYEKNVLGMACDEVIGKDENGFYLTQI